MQFLDSATLEGVKETETGYLVADAFTVRTGIQRYAGSEVGRPDLQFVDVYRPEEEVFSTDTLRSFSHVPLTDDHPTVAVDASNWKQLAIGEASTEVLRDGHRMRIPLVVKDAAAISKIKSGKRQLSAGYSCDLDFTDGKTADGEPYQAVQRNIRANHIALVKLGRAGPDFRIGDGAQSWGVAPVIKDEGIPMTLQKLTVDGITVEVTDQGAQVINKLQQQLADSGAKIVTLTNDHNTVVTAKDVEIGDLRAKLADAEKKVLTGPMLDAAVAERAQLVDTARKLVKDIKVEGLSDADIRRNVVTARYGETLTKDASDDVIRGMFNAAVADSGKRDGVRDTLIGDNGQKTSTVNDNGYSEYVKRNTEAWRKP